MNTIIPTLRNVLKGYCAATPPIWLMRQAGRYLPEYQLERQKIPNFMDFCFTPEAVIKVTLQPIERFDFDAAIIFSDILTIPHLLGQTVTFEAGYGPKLISIEWEKFLEKAEKTDHLEGIDPLFYSIQQVRQNLSAQKSLIGFAGSPWTIATYMIKGGKNQSFDEIIKFEEQFPNYFNRLLKILTRQVSQLLIDQIKAGCDVVQLFDSWASVVPSEKREQWLWQPLSSILSAVNDACPDVPVIYYGKGVSDAYPLLVKRFPNLAFGLDQSVDCQWAKEFIQSPVQGNLDPEKLVEGNFKEDTNNILNTFKGKPFVFNLGHGILPTTPVKHVYQLIEMVKNSFRR